MPLLERFIGDQTKWVRNAMLQQLGQFIAALPSAQVLLGSWVRVGTAGTEWPMGMRPAESEQITPALLRHYVGLGELDARHQSVEAADPNLPAACAFCFPGVLQTVGVARWAELRPLFHNLARNPEKSVRVPISHALHEVRTVAWGVWASPQPQPPSLAVECVLTPLATAVVPPPLCRSPVSWARPLRSRS